MLPRRHSRCRIEDPRPQHQTAPNRAKVYVLGGEASCDGIVRPKQQDDMYKGHADQEGDQRRKGQPVLLEQLFRADESAGDSKQDDDRGKTCAPPADEEGRPVRLRGAGGRRRGVERHQDHARRRPGRFANAPLCRFADSTRRGRVLAGSIEGIPGPVSNQTTTAALAHGRWHGLVACSNTGSGWQAEKWERSTDRLVDGERETDAIDRWMERGMAGQRRMSGM
jgi:hypothetical protein